MPSAPIRPHSPAYVGAPAVARFHPPPRAGVYRRRTAGIGVASRPVAQVMSARPATRGLRSFQAEVAEAARTHAHRWLRALDSNVVHAVLLPGEAAPGADDRIAQEEGRRSQSACHRAVDDDTVDAEGERCAPAVDPENVEGLDVGGDQRATRCSLEPSSADQRSQLPLVAESCMMIVFP